MLSLRVTSVNILLLLYSDKLCHLNVLASAVHILKLERYRED